MKKYPHGIKILLFVLLFIAGSDYLLVQSIATATVGQLQFPRPYEIGEASYYSYECANLPMANGKTFDPEKRTCASWFYRFGTVLRVRSLETGRMTEVVVTDRGPNRRLVKRGRIIDLSKRAFQDICDPSKGLTDVIVTVRSRPHYQ